MSKRIAAYLRRLADRLNPAPAPQRDATENQLQALAIVLVDSGIGERLFEVAFRPGIDACMKRMRYEVDQGNLDSAKYQHGYARALETAYSRMEQFATKES